jgi:sec-independent protein translocase protein TatA
MAVPQFAILDIPTTDLVIILAIVLLLFGAKKLPELSKSIGTSARELRKGLNGDEEKKPDQNSSQS